MALLSRDEANDIAAVIELDIVLAADLDTLDGIIERIQSQRLGGLSLDTAGLAQIMYLVEVVGIAGLLGDTFQMGLAINFDTHD